MNPTQELLVAARAVIEDEEHWTQGAIARDDIGVSISPDPNIVATALRPEAEQWCALGALGRAFGTSDPQLDTAAWSAAQRRLNDAAMVLANRRSFTSFNDSYEHLDVLDMFDLAIKQAADV